MDPTDESFNYSTVGFFVSFEKFRYLTVYVHHYLVNEFQVSWIYRHYPEIEFQGGWTLPNYLVSQFQGSWSLPGHKKTAQTASTIHTVKYSIQLILLIVRQI